MTNPSDFNEKLLQIPLKTLDHQSFSLREQKPKVLVFVNTASECGYTPQYKGLQALFEKYQQQGVLVVGVPCNQFGAQEPGSEKDIQNFCAKNFGVKFPILEKTDVKGHGQHALFRFLIENSSSQEEIKWNFEKFVVIPQKSLVQRFKSADSPEKISEWIDAHMQFKV